MAPILAYWNLRGIGNPIRMILHHANELFEDKRYDDFKEWFEEDKPALQGTLDFPNLPYFIDGKVQMSQMKAILSYLGRKHNLNAKTETERLRIDMANEYVDDMRRSLINMAYLPGTITNRDEVHEKLLQEYEDQLPAKLSQLSNFLKENKWIAGDHVTYMDFYIYDILDWHRLLLDPKIMEEQPILWEYLTRFEQLSGVKEYLGSPAFQRLPIYAPFAMYGNTADFKFKPRKSGN